MKNKQLKKIFSPDFLTVLGVLVLYAVMSVLLYGGMTPRQVSNMLISISCYIVLAVSLNMVVGLLGELSLGHAGFMSVGLFSGCLLSIYLKDALPLVIRLPFCMVVGGLFAALVGLLVGLPALRLKGDYLAIVTLACGEIIKNIINNLDITGGALGLNTQPILQNTKTLFPYAIVLVVLSVWMMLNFRNSKHGRAVMAIRDNRIAAEASGIHVTSYKLLTFAAAAFFAGMAGVLYGHNIANIKSATFDYNMSIEILVIVVLGGMGSIRGSVIAAIILRTLPEILRDFSDYRMLAYSILLIVIMLANGNKAFREWKESLGGKVKSIFRRKNAEKGDAA